MLAPISLLACDQPVLVLQGALRFRLSADFTRPACKIQDEHKLMGTPNQHHALILGQTPSSLFCTRVFPNLPIGRLEGSIK